MKSFLYSFILLSIAFSINSKASPNKFSYAQDTLRYLKNPNYIQQMGLYKIYKVKHANIVMLGNSITHGVNWADLLGRTDVVGEGITSDVLEGFLNRLYYVTKLHPKVCFIMGGINDIYNWNPVENIFQEYVTLIRKLQARYIKVVIQSTLYVASRYPDASGRNKQVTKLNRLLKDFAKKNNIDFIDLNKKMSTNDFLMDNLTFDGVHLNANGYAIWRKEIEKELSKLGI